MDRLGSCMGRNSSSCHHGPLWQYKDSGVQDNGERLFSCHSSKCWVYICCAAIALLSFLVKIHFDRRDSQSLYGETYGHVNKDGSINVEKTNTSAEEGKNGRY